MNKKWLLRKYLIVVAIISLVTLSINSLPQTFVQADSNNFAGGQGTETNPYKIATAEQLNNVRNYLNNSNVYFRLIANIDLATFNNGEWIPIGDNIQSFSGKFDGNGFTILNLQINDINKNYIGLFGYANSNAVIQNLNLLNVNIQGNNDTGALVGFNKGKIKNLLVTGEVNGNFYLGGMVGESDSGEIENSISKTDVTGYDRVGGLVGINSATIKNSSATGNITGNNMVGGLVGSSYSNSTIKNSYASGNVNGDSKFGGLVGNLFNKSSITNSYATGNVDGNVDIGGLVGYGYISDVINSYATGNVTGNNIVGGLVGYAENAKIHNSVALNLNIQSENVFNIGRIFGINISGSVNNNYALVDMSVNGTQKTSTNSQSKDGADITEQEAEDSSKYPGWDFINTWKIDATSGYPYPTLRTAGAKYTLNIQSIPPIGGETSTTEYNPGEEINIQAQPKPGYRLVNWELNNAEISTQANFTFYMPMMDVTLVANYEKDSYNLTVQSNNSEWGTVTGGGIVEYDADVTVRATPNPGYKFINWTDENGDEISNAPEYTFAMPANDVTIKANFAKESYNLIVQSNNSEWGTVTGGGIVEYDADVTARATPNPGYKFINWTDENGEEISKAPEYTFAMPANDVTIKANFAKESYTLTVQANNSNMGTVAGGGTYEFGSPVTVTATPNPGYKFVNWTDEKGTVLSTNPTFTYTMPTNAKTIIANFKKISTVTAKTNQTSEGTVTGSGTFEVGSTVTLTATPKQGYRFAGWYINGKLVSTDPSYTYTVPEEDVTVEAKFEKIQVNAGGNLSTDNPEKNKGGNFPTFEETEKPSKEEGAKLPKTAMNYMNWLLAGLAFILIGFTVYVINRRNRSNA